jgi:hypothetical protein
MHIDQAIKTLKEAKKNGTQAIILAYWDADMFDREDNQDWECDTSLLEDHFDWSRTHDQLSCYLDSLQEP